MNERSGADGLRDVCGWGLLALALLVAFDFAGKAAASQGVGDATATGAFGDNLVFPVLVALAALVGGRLSRN